MTTGNTGLLAQIGFADEVTYGTYVAPTKFYEFRPNENIKLDITRIASQAIRAGRYNKARAGAYAPWRKGAKGPVELEVLNKNFGFLLKHMLGSIVSSQPAVGTDPTVWQHTASVASLAGRSFSFQTGRPDLSTGVLPFVYKGGKIQTWELTSAPNELLPLKLEMDFQDEDTSQTLTTASYPTTPRLYSFVDAALTVGGTAFDVRSFSIKGVNNLKADRYFVRGQGLKKEPLDVGRDYTGTLEVDFDTLTAYTRFVNATEVAFTATWTGPIISHAFAYSLAISATVRFDGDTPNNDTTEVLKMPQPFVILDDSLTLTYQTTDSTP